MNNNLIDLQQIKNVFNTEKLIIKLGLLNIRSLSTKTLFVNDMVTDYNLDVLCFTETWLKSDEYINKKWIPLQNQKSTSRHSHSKRSSKTFTIRQGYILKTSLPALDAPLV